MSKSRPEPEQGPLKSSENPQKRPREFWIFHQIVIITKTPHNGLAKMNANLAETVRHPQN